MHLSATPGVVPDSIYASRTAPLLDIEAATFHTFLEDELLANEICTPACVAVGRALVISLLAPTLTSRTHLRQPLQDLRYAPEAVDPWASLGLLPMEGPAPVVTFLENIDIPMKLRDPPRVLRLEVACAWLQRLDCGEITESIFRAEFQQAGLAGAPTRPATLGPWYRSRLCYQRLH